MLANISSRKIFVLSDLAPDPSAGLDFKGVIAQGFLGPFLLKRSWRDFEKVDEGRKLSRQLWVRMAGYWNYIKYAGRKMKTLMWIRIAVYQKYISSTYIFISSFVSLSKYAKKTKHSDVATYDGRIHFYLYFRVQFEQSTVATYGGILKLFIIHISFYLFLSFSDKVRGTKTEHSDEATYGGRIHVYIFLAYCYLANVSYLDCR